MSGNYLTNRLSPTTLRPRATAFRSVTGTSANFAQGALGRKVVGDIRLGLC